MSGRSFARWVDACGAQDLVDGRWRDGVPLGNTMRSRDLRVLRGQAAWVYSLIRPPRTGLRWIRAMPRPVTAARGM